MCCKPTFAFPSTNSATYFNLQSLSFASLKCFENVLHSLLMMHKNRHY